MSSSSNTGMWTQLHEQVGPTTQMEQITKTGK